MVVVRVYLLGAQMSGPQAAPAFRADRGTVTTVAAPGVRSARPGHTYPGIGGR
jgi:hypothetical protein